MSQVRHLPVTEDEADMRLDRWLRAHLPGIGQGRVQKLLRTGQVRVDGGRAKADTRLLPGQTVRVPPVDLAPPGDAPAAAAEPPTATQAEPDADALAPYVIHADDAVLVLNKPAGLAVQGGTGIRQSLDDLMRRVEAATGERLRLTHRLDRDTSGVIVLARTAAAARHLTAAFRSRRARKLYWAVTVGAPPAASGRIERPVAKLPGPAGERMVVDEAGQPAVTLYRIIERARREAAAVALRPITGRTHQLRVHLADLGTPILGDGKYGGKAAFLVGLGVSRKLHLHARAIVVPHPDGGDLAVTAPLPEHMATTWRFFAFPEPAGTGDELLLA